MAPAIELRETLEAAERACAEFSGTVKNVYLPHGEMLSLAAGLKDRLAGLGFEFFEVDVSAEHEHSGHSNMVHHDVGIYASIVIDRAGGDGERATSWAFLHNTEIVRERLRKLAIAEKRAATKSESAELKAAQEYAAGLERQLAAAHEAAAAQSVPAPAKSAWLDRLQSIDRFQLIELE